MAFLIEGIKMDVLESVVGVYPVNRLQSCMADSKSRELAEIFRLPVAHVKFGVAIGISTQVGCLGL